MSKEKSKKESLEFKKLIREVINGLDKQLDSSESIGEIHYRNLSQLNVNGQKLSKGIEYIMRNPKINIFDSSDVDIVKLIMLLNEFSKQGIELIEKIKDKYTVKNMTIEEIEKELGHKINIVDEDEDDEYGCS